MLTYWEEEEEEEGRRHHLHVSYIDVGPCRAAESSKLWCLKGMPASLRLEREWRDKMFRQDKLTGDLGREAALPAAMSAQQHSHVLCLQGRKGGLMSPQRGRLKPGKDNCVW